MQKHKLLYYSDSPTYAGCENMLAEFITSKQLNSCYSVFFIYKYSREYNEALKARLNIDEYNIVGTKIPDNNRMLSVLKTAIKNRFARRVIGFPFLWFWKYYCVIKSIRPLYRQLKKINPDIIHINNGGYPAAPSCYSVIIAARLCGVKRIVYVVNNIAQNYIDPLRWFDFFLDFIVKRNVNYFVTGSKFALTHLRTVLKIHDDKLISIPNGSKLRTILMNPDEVKKKYGIPKGKVLFLVGAILEKRKGHIFLLRAIKELKEALAAEDMPLFFFAGDGAERGHIKNYIEDNCLGDVVYTPGAVTNIFDIINASDALIQPSISHEDFPFIIIEGMSLGKPVIGSIIAGIPEQILHDETGLLVESKNVDMLAKAIVRLMDHGTRHKFGIKALERYRSRFTIEESISKYIELYNSLM